MSSGNKEKNFVSVVIYVHNAEKRIEKFLKMIISVLEENFEHSEIVCVNDCSKDDSVSIIRGGVAGSAASVSISVLNMSYFHGLEMAMNAGTDLTIGDFVFEFDNIVLDFDKDLIMQVYWRALQGYDIVSLAPKGKEKFGSRLFYLIFDKFTSLSYKMGTESFRILSRRVINRISSMNRTSPYRKAVYANCGLKTDVMVYVPTNKEIPATDKREIRYRFGLAINSLILFTDIGYRFSITMTVLMMLVSAFMVFYSIFIYVTENPVAGWTTTILFLSIAFLGLFAILTVIIRYLQILVELVFKRKHYSFESIEKITK